MTTYSNLTLIPPTPTTNLDALTLAKTESKDYPYSLFILGREINTFTSLDDAQDYLAAPYRFRRDPTRFFFPSQESSSSDPSTAKPLVLIVMNISAQARFARYLSQLIRDYGPQRFEPMLEQAATALNLSAGVCGDFLGDLIRTYHLFEYVDDIVYLPFD